MNIILCNKNCVHQKEGYCGLTYTQYVANSSNNSCPYFCKDAKNKNNQKISIFNKISKTE